MDLKALQMTWSTSLRHEMSVLDRQVLLQQLLVAMGDAQGYPQDNLRLLLSRPNYQHRIHVFIHSNHSMTLLKNLPGFEELSAVPPETSNQMSDRFVTLELSPKRETVLDFDWGYKTWLETTQPSLREATTWPLWLEHFKTSLIALRQLQQGRVGSLPDTFESTLTRVKEELRHMYFDGTFKTNKTHILDWPSWLLVHPGLGWHTASWKSYRFVGVPSQWSTALCERATSLLEVHACLEEGLLDSTLMALLEQPIMTADYEPSGIDFN